MSQEEIISAIRGYCEKGLLDGLYFDVAYHSDRNILRAENIHAYEGVVYFTESRVYPNGLDLLYECDDLSEHDFDYIEALFAEINKRINVNIDRNLF